MLSLEPHPFPDSSQCMLLPTNGPGWEKVLSAIQGFGATWLAWSRTRGSDLTDRRGPYPLAAPGIRGVAQRRPGKRSIDTSPGGLCGHHQEFWPLARQL